MSAPEEFDTICAVATPAGMGGIGIVRISGPAALEVAGRLFVSSSREDIRDARSHTIHQGVILDPASGETVDEVLVSVMRAPRTYTREDVVEVHAHGNPHLLQRLLRLVASLGVRPAGPGEFTRRAFLNGRIDLTEAEAVMELIGARSEAGRRAAVVRLKGGLGRQIEGLCDRTGRLLAGLEARIDFPEEDLDPLERGPLIREIRELQNAIRGLLSTAEAGRIFQEGVAAVIVGRPNVGKSSLLNRLLDEDRAIVSDIPGTTRDLIQETIHAGGVPLRIMDTAGLRSSRDRIEIEGMKKTEAAIESADLILLIVDAQNGMGREEEELLKKHAADRKMILAVNKADLAGEAARRMAVEASRRLPAVAISATRGDGMGELLELIEKTTVSLNIPGQEQVLVAQVRQKVSLEDAERHLGLAIRSAEAGVAEDFIALDLRSALNRLGEIVGTVTTEDLLDQIFKDFCIGK